MKVNLRKTGVKVLLKKRFVNLTKDGRRYVWR